MRQRPNESMRTGTIRQCDVICCKLRISLEKLKGDAIQRLPPEDCGNQSRRIEPFWIATLDVSVFMEKHALLLEVTQTLEFVRDAYLPTAKGNRNCNTVAFRQSNAGRHRDRRSGARHAIR